MLLRLVMHYGAARVIAHYQVLPEDWPETLPYVQQLCTHLGVRLVAQQILYQPVGDRCSVKRREIRDIHSEADIVPLGTPGVIAGVTDLAFRRKWPPSPATRYCTKYGKIELLDAWLRQHRVQLGPDLIIALGERAGESPRRARKPTLWPRLRWADGTVAWNWEPVHDLSRRAIFRTLHAHTVAPHPAYAAQGMTPWQMYDQDTEGGPRTGCRFCIYATQSDVCHQAQRAENQALRQYIEYFETTTGRTWWMQRAMTTLFDPERPFQLRLI